MRRVQGLFATEKEPSSQPGLGIDPAVTRSSGLTNMRRRAEQLAGTFELTSRPEGGPCLRWHIPLTAKGSPHSS